ncbi:dihydrolipoamide dehydrogenase [Brachybacterium muris]|uniref:Dihydrolipoyl dehydrogenase n=1 Tax=Brachybacterium muris UCD-AY4 TaxID=1249481 RepID=A0A022L3A1_9MICO|nr:dihydrolipoyl dehydrogenase [Brachybacterium muris]EYT50420.1 dihydrolipoamide dehydrogenase [Brachybacterium muris UCD-AY4]MBM7500746.1 dihydrolipoamide dehydrogenase [Brachybacterium muris]MCT1430254.1 dihydrolipoyl dehydrogenase [Brachybacterium muris]MCT1654035.1 dihydrolipoyl dehydrogenase [Brachybacterium muris]MCT2177050.1 dihydrolipoyl dehydrogenase [Brachybacterium muris]
MAESTTDQYDVVILGGGSGGYAAALRGAQLGLRIAMVEKDKLGGTCLHRGCVPTKAMLHVGEVADAPSEGKDLGLDISLNAVDIEKVLGFKDKVIGRLYKGLQGLVKSRDVEYIEGFGRLTGKDTVTVETEGGTRELRGKNIVLATGSFSKTLPGIELGGRILDSEAALQLPEVPKNPIILGGGVIGVEFASVWKSLGAESVTIVEGLPHLVANEDESLSKALERSYKKRGITFSLGVFTEKVEPSDSGVKVTLADGTVFEGDYLLVAVGRGPVTKDLGYEEQGIEMDRGFVLADKGTLETSVPGIYAVGDIVPGLQLAHRGFQQGIFVAELIAGQNPAPIVESGIPRITYCEPQLGSVGLTEKQAKEQLGDDAVQTYEYNLGGNGKSQILGTTGFIKLVREKDGPIVGVHMIGSRMSELMGEAQLIVNWEAYPEDVASLIHGHPTQHEAMGEAALALAGKPLHAHA